MATGYHHSLGQSLMLRRRQAGPRPLCAVVCTDNPLPCACIGGQGEANLLVWCPGKRDNNVPEHVGKMRAQKWSQFFAEENSSEKVSAQISPCSSLRKDLHCDSLLCKEGR